MPRDPQLCWWRNFRTIDDIEIFAVDLSSDLDREDKALGLLDEEERTRYHRFKVEDARRGFLLSRGGLRILLGERLSQPPRRLSFGSGKYGKPYALIGGAPAPVSFNISHSGDDALIAITPSRRIGVDLEQRRPLADFDGIAARVFSAGEREALSRLQGGAKAKLFYRLWTCKEALIKAKGTGFSYNPVQFQVPGTILDGASSAEFGFPDDEMPGWVLTDAGTDQFAAALAYRR